MNFSISNPEALPTDLSTGRTRRMSSLAPSLAPSLAWTSLREATAKGAAPEGELVSFLSRLDPAAISLPSKLNGVYSDLEIAEYKLRIYALAWSMTLPAESALSLFLVLGPVQGSYLPMGSRISVRENNLLLTDSDMRWTTYPAYLYTQVFGSWQEKFTVEVLLPNSRPLTMPSMSF